MTITPHRITSEVPELLCTIRYRLGYCYHHNILWVYVVYWYYLCIIIPSVYHWTTLWYNIVIYLRVYTIAMILSWLIYYVCVHACFAYCKLDASCLFRTYWITCAKTQWFALYNSNTYTSEIGKFIVAINQQEMSKPYIFFYCCNRSVTTNDIILWKFGFLKTSPWGVGNPPGVTAFIIYPPSSLG